MYTIAISGADVYAGGAFVNAGGDADADYIARWNGSAWVALGSTPLNNVVYDFAFDGSGNLYAGGEFINAGGDANADKIARWDGSAWSALSNAGGMSGLSGSVNALYVDANGSVYAGGSFNNAGTIQCQSIAVYTKPLGDALDILANMGEQYQARGDEKYVPYAQQADTLDPTGWIDPSAVTVTYSQANRTITLTGTLVYYWRGEKKTLTSPWTSSAHSSTKGNYYLYTTDGTTFAWSTDAWSFDQLMVAKVIKVTLESGTEEQVGIREVHGLMPWQVHRELHEQISSYRESGGGLTAGTYAENTATDAANTPGFDAGAMRDEDLPTSIAAWTQGTYTTMRIGASSIARFDNAATLPFRAGASYIYVNTPSTGAEAATVTGRYVNIYRIWVPTTADAESQKYRSLFLQPQAAYTSLAAAQAEDVRGLALGDFSTTAPEFVFYERITYVTNAADTNTGKVRIATGGITYIYGNRQAQVSAIATPNAENIPVAPAGNISATNVQLALEELDAEKLATTGGTLTGALTGGAYRTIVNVTADDAAFSITPANANGIIIVGTNDATAWGMFFYNTVGPTCTALNVGSNTNATTGALAGTTGTDTKFTVSAHATDAKLYFENRRGAQRSIYVLLM